MKINLFDIEKFIKINKCPQVTNPVYMDPSRYPTKDGLFSYELFGLPGSYDRKTVFGYIDLKKKYFLHPAIYKIITTLDKKYLYLIDGSKYFSIVDGKLVEDENNGNTGLEFLYNNWEKLIFDDRDSLKREDKLSVIRNLDKNEIFISKYLVIPPFYRDLNFAKLDQGKPSVDIINEMYVSILNITSNMDKNIGFDFIGAMTENRLQLKLVEIYTFLTQSLAKKNGLIREYLLGKRTDYSTRAVISAPKFNQQKWNEQKVNFEHTGVPLSHMCNLFFPFFVKEITDFLSEEFNSTNFIYLLKDGENKIKDDMSNLERIYLKNPMDDYTPDKIKKLINTFIKSPKDRFMILSVNTEKGYLPLNLYYTDLHRPFTLADLLYIISIKIAENKHVYVTRYPVENYQNIYPSKIYVMSTYKTVKQKLGNKYFEDYPEIYPEYPDSENFFQDSLIPSNLMLKALGGDYDGDMLSVRAVFSQEANIEAKNIIESKKHILNGNGDNIRTTEKEAVMTIFALTRD